MNKKAYSDSYIDNMGLNNISPDTANRLANKARIYSFTSDHNFTIFKASKTNSGIKKRRLRLWKGLEKRI